jgi:hypothetical protein
MARLHERNILAPVCRAGASKSLNKTREGRCKLLKMWWPGADLVPLPPLTARKLLFLRRARFARTPRPASFWHTIGTLLIRAGRHIINIDLRLFNSHSFQTAVAGICART